MTSTVPAAEAAPAQRTLFDCRDSWAATIAEVARGLAPGPWVAHVSGATSLDALEPHARRFSMHPLQTFTLDRGPEQLDGAYAAVSAETDSAREVGLWLARTLGLVLTADRTDGRRRRLTAVLVQRDPDAVPQDAEAAQRVVGA